MHYCAHSQQHQKNLTQKECLPGESRISSDLKSVESDGTDMLAPNEPVNFENIEIGNFLLVNV